MLFQGMLQKFVANYLNIESEMLSFLLWTISCSIASYI
jgi:hypothetical protein